MKKLNVLKEYAKNFGYRAKEYLSSNKYKVAFIGGVAGLATWRLIFGELYELANAISAITPPEVSPDISYRADCPISTGEFHASTDLKIYHPSDHIVVKVETVQGDILTGGVYNSHEGLEKGLNSLFQVSVDDSCGNATFSAVRLGDPSKYPLYSYGQETVFVRSNATQSIHTINVLFSP